MIKYSHKSNITYILIFAFLFLLFSDSYPLQGEKKSKGIQIVNEGEAFYNNFKYEEALDKYRAAFPLIKSKKNLLRIYMNMSKAYYALSDKQRTKEVLVKLFKIKKKHKINEKDYPRGYLKIFKEAKNWKKQQKILSKEGKRRARKKFPWLLIIGGVAAIVIAILLLKKKETNYTLTVEKRDGVTGTPSTGTYTYLAGSGVSYNYTLQEGYGDLSVMLDGNNVSSSGTITMDRDRTLNIAAGKQYTLTVNRGSGVTGDPASGTYVYTDGNIIDYNYSISNNFSNLTVTLDDNNVNMSGQITMDQDHTLMAASQNTNYDTEVLKIDWVRIPAGEFKMGTNLTIDYLPNSQPMHTVYLDTYYMSKYEVTFDQYDNFCDDTGRTKPSDEGWGRGNRPVINVSWNDAVAFCNWLSEKTGKTIKLPTEAQWEKAARGTDQRMFPWGNETPNSNLCNINMYIGKTSPVGSYPSGVSPYGIHDMEGNVYEWCFDWFDSNYYSSSPKNNPQGPSTGTSRTMRGGCWSIIYDYTFSRSWGNPDDRGYVNGFRIVKSN